MGRVEVPEARARARRGRGPRQSHVRQRRRRCTVTRTIVGHRVPMTTGTADASGKGVHRRPPSVRATAGLAALLTVALTAVAWFRLDGTTARHRLGWTTGFFLEDAVEQGLWSSLFDSYAGYLHVVPRLVVQGVLWVAPFSDFVAAVTLASCLVAGPGGGAGLRLQRRGGRPCLRPGWPWARSPCLVPAAPIEVSGQRRQPALVLPVAGAVAADGRAHQVADRHRAGGRGAPRGAHRDPGGALRPAWCWSRPGTSSGLPVVLGLLLGVAAQVVATLTSPRTDPYGEPPNIHDLVEAYPVHVVVPVWMPKFHGIRATPFDTWPMVLLACLPFVVLARVLVASHRGPPAPAPPRRPAGPGDRGVLRGRSGGPLRGRLLAQPRRAAGHRDPAPAGQGAAAPLRGGVDDVPPRHRDRRRRPAAEPDPLAPAAHARPGRGRGRAVPRTLRGRAGPTARTGRPGRTAYERARDSLPQRRARSARSTSHRRRTSG